MVTPQSPRSEEFPPFRTADGRRWTHTRERGWVRSVSFDAELAPAEEPSARQAYEDEPSVEARGPMQTLLDAGANILSTSEQNTALAQLNAALDEEARRIAEEARSAQERRDLEMVELRSQYTEQWPVTASGRLRLRNRIRLLLRETVDAHVLRQQREGYDIEFDPVWEAAHRAVCEWDGLPNNAAVTRLSDMISRWNEPVVSDQDEGEAEGEDEMPSALQTYSSSSSSQSEPEDGTDVTAHIRRIARARRSLVFTTNRPGRMLSQHQTQVRQQLRVLQECLDTEMATAASGTPFSEGSYLSMMNAVKAIWQTVDSAFVL